MELINDDVVPVYKYSDAMEILKGSGFEDFPPWYCRGKTVCMFLHQCFNTYGRSSGIWYSVEREIDKCKTFHKRRDFEGVLQTNMRVNVNEIVMLISSIDCTLISVLTNSGVKML